MIKAIIFLTKIVVVVFVAMMFSSCRYHVKLDDNDIEGNGNVRTETRILNENFQSISVESSIEVVVEQSDEKSVIVEADENILPHVTTRVEGGVLHIEFGSVNIINSSTAKVIVKMPVIKALSSSSSSSIKSNNTIITDNLVAKADSNGEIEINVEADNLSLQTESSGSIIATGKALKLKTSSSSGSELDAKALMANDVISESDSGSSTNVYPILSLDAHASSGSSITYHKMPKSISKESNSGGNISQ